VGRTVSYRITACIDDHDKLYFERATFQWVHFSKAYPGQHPACGGNKATSIVVTTKPDNELLQPPSSYTWTPVFDGPLVEGNPASESFNVKDADAMPTSIKGSKVTFSHSTVAGRGTVSITSPPNNIVPPDWVCQIEITDGLDGPDTYVVLLTFREEP